MNAARAFGMVVLWSMSASCSCSKPAQHVEAAPANSPAPTSAPAKVPSAAGPAADSTAVKLCEHRVPADLCTQCNPELAEVFKEKGDWCGEHGVPESHCFKCNPKLDFTAKAPVRPTANWCNEHGVPESMCTKCKPELVASFVAKGDYCREHGFPESVCPICHPEKVSAAGHEPPVFPKPGTKVKLASAETEREIGIETHRVAPRPFTRSLDVVGELRFNENRLARLSARGEGVVVEVKVDIGDEVKRGQPLAVLASGAIGQDQSKLAAGRARLETATAALARERSLLESGISSRRSVEQAQAEVAAARADYQGANAALRAAGATEAGAGRYALTAPFPGTVVSRNAVAGKTVSPGDILVEVADLSTMWALLDVPQDAASSVAPGQKVHLRLDGAPGNIVEGTISRLAAAADTRTRTVRARVDLPNPRRTLRAGIFIRASIELKGPEGALLVPQQAVQRAEGSSLVFVRTAPGQYDPRPVEVRSRVGELAEVVRGLSPGDEIVTTGAFLLKTEILKDSIGAGCVDD